MQLRDHPSASPTPARRFNRAGLRTRTAILQAAIEVIAAHSLSGTTVERVADKAGIAVGTVMLHFKRKDALLVAVLEHISGEFEAARHAAIASARGDAARALLALVDVTFDRTVSDPAKVAVWYAFWGEAKARGTYLERVGRADEDYHHELEALFGALIAAGDHRHLRAGAVAMGFAGLLEYQWQSILVEGRRFDRAEARDIAIAYLAGNFPREFSAYLQTGGRTDQ
jgi:TetR/AcrR family transcriptional repressor of bet genes